MRTLALALLLAGAATAAVARDCVRIRDIGSTETQGSRTIIFHMRNRVTLVNTLPADCPGLAMNSAGFTYVATPGPEEICATETAIRMNSTGAVCQLGAFKRM